MDVNLDEPTARDRAIMAALDAGAPWWLAIEAAATVELDRDDVGTHSV